METLPAIQRVAAGAEFLDDARPGWRALVNVDVLDLDSIANCVYGQVFGSWASDDQFTMSQAKWNTDHGFYATSTVDRFDLKVEWVKVITGGE